MHYKGGGEQDVESNLYYFGARFYDPAAERWLSVDPLSDIFPSITPYNYTYNSPVNSIDPNGVYTIATTGAVTLKRNTRAELAMFALASLIPGGSTITGMRYLSGDPNVSGVQTGLAIGGDALSVYLRMARNANPNVSHTLWDIAFSPKNKISWWNFAFSQSMKVGKMIEAGVNLNGVGGEVGTALADEALFGMLEQMGYGYDNGGVFILIGELANPKKREELLKPLLNKILQFLLALKGNGKEDFLKNVNNTESDWNRYMGAYKNYLEKEASKSTMDKYDASNGG